jgi:predicted dehydrogenase
LGRGYAEAFAALGHEVTAVADPASARLGLAAAERPGALLSASLAEVVGDPSIEAVVIATAPAPRPVLTRIALGTGKHVLVAGPLVRSAREVEHLVHLARWRERVLQVGHPGPEDPAVESARGALAAPTSGRARILTARRSLPAGAAPARPDGDALWDLLSHDVAFFLALVGAPPESVAAHFVSWGDDDPFESVTVTLGWSDGPLAQIELALAQGDRRDEIAALTDGCRVALQDPNPLAAALRAERAIPGGGAGSTPPLFALASDFAEQVARRRLARREAAGGAVARVLEAARESLLARCTRGPNVPVSGSALERAVASALLLA